MIEFIKLSFSYILLILFDISAKTVLRRDDYWEIYEARHRGFFDYLLFIFLTNSGRYSAFLIKSLYAVLPPLLWIRITIFLCGLLLLGCCFRIAKRLAAGRTNAFLSHYRLALDLQKLLWVFRAHA